jgi:hypothetical protein
VEPYSQAIIVSSIRATVIIVCNSQGIVFSSSIGTKSSLLATEFVVSSIGAKQLLATSEPSHHY